MQAKIQFNCVISPYPAQKIVNLPLFKMNMELKEHFNNKIFKLISETADELGLECYVVGGYALRGGQAEEYVRYRDTGRAQSALVRMERQKTYIKGFLDAARTKSRLACSR